MMVKRRRVQKPSTDEPQAEPFPYADYVKARDDLLRALQGPSFYALLTGISGMGKTSLLRDLSAKLDRQIVLYISSSRASRVGVVRFLANKLHVGPRRSHIETVDVLCDAIQAQTSHLLLWMDEADQVETATLQEVRMLAESHLALEQLFSVVLSGLPQLLSRLDAPTLFPLKRRISRRYVLAGLHREELISFLVHRFGSVEADRIPAAIHDELFERTQATPALIDLVVRHALATAKGDIDLEDVRAALDTAGL
jgi:type II secretory pathway predicted ATPase ExeA